MNRNPRFGGIHPVRAALANTPERIVALWVDKQRRDSRVLELLQQCDALGIKPQPVERGFLDSLGSGGTHQGIAVEVRIPAERSEKELLQKIKTESEGLPLYLILDQVQDPHNLGACMRTADATGVQGIVVTRDHSVGITPTVYKVASGAAETVPVYRVTNLARILREFKKAGIWVIGAAGEARADVYASDLAIPLALVVGAEGSGLRRLTRDQCDLLIRLPLLGTVESLNVSVATGAILYEVLRQRSNHG